MVLPVPADPTRAEPPATLAAEHARLAAVRATLARMLDTARLRVATGESVAGDGYTAEVLGRLLRSNAKELANEPAGPVYFGRLWFGARPEAGDHRDQWYYLGRRHITDGSGEPMVIDWRAPVARAFYRASHRDPLGVRQRRRYGWTVQPPIELTGFEDEHLDREAPTGASRLVQAEIERPRVGPMRDIVATIQPEQDDLVRAELDESLCVQGGPGTGKTAVGLHRVAYLLYTHRQRLHRAGVLVVGPNPAFLRYISAVLPALGEVDVAQRTLAELLPPYPVTAVDSPAAAAVKHDARMATVLRRALYDRITLPTEPLTVPDGSYRWRVALDVLRRTVDEVRREAPPYALGRERLRARVVELLRRQAETRAETPGAAWARRMGRCRPVTAFLDATWPAVRPAELVAAVLGDPAVLARAAAGLLTPAEQAAIRWHRPRRNVRAAAWSAADLVLLDEAAGLLDHPPGFAHIVVDEAQDLSPMECRVIARRSRHGSLTVLGDLAQGTTEWAAANWSDQLTHLGKPAAAVVPLTAGFRVPGAVLSLANRLLPALRVEVPATRSVRTDGTVRIRAVSDLATATVDAVRAALDHPGSIAVIAVDARLAGLAAALEAGAVAASRADRDDSAGRVTLLPATLAKGLEYDHVIVVEPAEIVDAEPRGAHRLYVVLTRAVSRLDVVHQRPLPAALTTSGEVVGPSGIIGGDDT